MSRARLDPARALAHPVFLLALSLLVLNDRCLKGAGLLPALATGKLSDVAGMFVAPALLAWLARTESRRGFALAHLVVGVGFTVMELLPAAGAAADALLSPLGIRWIATSDLGDLAVLPLLLGSFVWSCRAADPKTLGPRAGARPVGLVALLACIGSADPPEPSCNGDCDQDGWTDVEDCNDFDAAVNPGSGNCPGEGGEDCENGEDDDGDGAADCSDPACAQACADMLDACQAAPVVDVAELLVLEGDTTLNGSWALDHECGGADAPELILTLAQAAGVVVLDVPEGHVLAARHSCELVSSELGCASEDALEIDLSQGPVTLVIDAEDALSAGPFSIPVDFVPFECGDGSLDPLEECDDANLEDGDGCSGCTVDLAAICSAPAALQLGDDVVTLSTPLAQLGSSCGASENRKAVLTFSSDSGGTLLVNASSSTTTPILSSRDICQGAEHACSAEGTLSVPYVAGTSLVIVVEAPPGALEGDIISLQATVL